jgi:hypothetical protein
MEIGPDGRGLDVLIAFDPDGRFGVRWDHGGPGPCGTRYQRSQQQAMDGPPQSRDHLG